jgi:N-acetylneuraminic acid mutarotase
LVIAAVVALLPLSALFELPYERDVKGWVGIDYKPPGYCAPIYDRGTFGAWQREGRLPTLLEEARAAGVGDAIYIVGGVITPVVDNFGRSTSAFRRYDPRSGRFTSLPPLPRPLNHVGVAARGNSIYVVGGLGNELEYRSIASDAAWRYDIAKRRWQELEPMPTARGALGAAIVDDTLYAIGGRNGPDSTDAVEAYDLTRGTWSSRAPIPGPGRDHLGVATLGGYVYVVAGRYDGGEEMNEFLRYDPRSDRWAEMPSLPIRTSGANLERVGNQLVITGGEGSKQEFLTGRTFGFDARAGSWRELPSSPRPRHGYASAGYGGRLYVFGGARCAGSTPVDTIESLRVRAAKS